MRVSREEFPLKMTDETLDYFVNVSKRENSKIMKFSKWSNTYSAPYMYNVGLVFEEDLEMEYKGLTVKIDGNSVNFMKGSVVSITQNDKGEPGIHIQNPNIPKSLDIDWGAGSRSSCVSMPKNKSGSCNGCSGGCKND